MSRTAATVLVRPVSDPRATLRCLDRLRPTLSTRDAVVVLVPDGCRAMHPLPRGVRCIAALPGETTDDLATRAADSCGTPLVADLHADVTVTPHWLDRLATALEDPAVVAAGPRSDAAPPGQYVHDAGLGPRTSLRDAARAWASRPAEPPTPVDRGLPAFCRLRRTGESGAGVVVHGVLVQHAAAHGCPDAEPADGDPSAPLLSAALIVKDEEDCIAACIEAANRFADEVVVYDTGSTDRTRGVAAALGATVVAGFWDDDFGAARNRGLAHCSGRWVLVVDADEVLLGDPAALRARLRVGVPEGLQVAIRNLTSGGVGTADGHVNLRIFRRLDAAYDGRLHEQVVHRRLGRRLGGSPQDDVVIEHSGYLAERVAAKAKVARNLALAEVHARESAGTPAGAEGAANLARAVCDAGDYPRALTLFEAAWQQAVPPRLRLRLAQSAFGCALVLRDLPTARRWLDRLDATDGCAPRVALQRARLLEVEGDPEAALSVLAGLPATWTDDDGLEQQRACAAAQHARLLVRLGRHDEAARELLLALRAGTSDVHLCELLAVLRDAGRPVADLAAALPPALRMAFLAQALQAVPADGNALLEAMWARGEQLDVLATAARLAPGLDVERALEWAVRLRERGVSGPCPLLVLAGDPGRSARDRCVAAVVAHTTFADPRAMPLLEHALSLVPDDEADAVCAQMAVLAPELGIGAAGSVRAAG